MKYSIGNLKFRTKKESYEYTKLYINKMGVSIIKNDSEEYIFLSNLLKNHHQYKIKVGAGIEYFFISTNAINRKYLQTNIKRSDGSDIDFSWVNCSKFTKKNDKLKLSSAMRSSIKTFIYEYRKTQKLICNYCKSLNKDEYHIDHDYPSFQQLQKDFLKIASTSVPTTFSDCPLYKYAIFNIEDNRFESEWVEYHNKNCKLQVLCRECNLKKG